jgi:hypothetical protein
MAAHAHAVRASAPNPNGASRAVPASASSPGSLVTWYLGLIPHWMDAQPRLKCCILLRTHQWILERVLAPDVGLAAALGDLHPGGTLTRTLGELVPADDAEHWRQFIALVVANLRHALMLPVARRNEAWVRWLFLIPYSAGPAAERAAHRPGPQARQRLA